MRMMITGIGSGLGKALVEEALSRSWEVFALSRKNPLGEREGLHFFPCDLRALESIHLCLEKLLEGVERLELVILNAGILGKLKDMREVSLWEMEEVMRVNLWANKVIIDSLSELGLRVDQLIAISSGAARNCNRGWNAYSISKASLNCLIKLYSHELPETHMIALAPGLVLTPMLEEVMSEDEEKFPSVGRIKRSPKLLPVDAARFILDSLELLRTYESGSFVDVRDLPTYPEYIEKYGVV
ncbi:MAG: SDR family NAD(P)-dependent oxidoreductase [Aquificae bacterium]|nr:SDR family NAD(P)-dependent oxidoreductase [Aquificota bacterium]